MPKSLIVELAVPSGSRAEKMHSWLSNLLAPHRMSVLTCTEDLTRHLTPTYKVAHAIYDTVEKQVFINSVHDTPQGALVNGLLLCYGVIVQQNWTYPMIRQRWEKENSRRRYAVVQVTVGTSGDPVEI